MDNSHQTQIFTIQHNTTQYNRTKATLAMPDLGSRECSVGVEAVHIRTPQLFVAVARPIRHLHKEDGDDTDH